MGIGIWSLGFIIFLILILESMTIQELSRQPDKLTSGHRLCAGCGAAICVRIVLSAIKEPVVVATATGCLEVATTIYPYTAWNVPWIHNAFENAAATISGIERAHKALLKKKRLNRKYSSKFISDWNKFTKTKFVAFGGDGGSYDIGLQSLSGALERRHKFLYICYDNEAYANTGVQRSSATPRGASSTTTPAGKVLQGKEIFRKDLTAIVAAHNIGYVAQASISHWADLVKKTEKAIKVNGPSFINIISPCPRGWRFPTNQTVRIAQLAVETNFWPLYEVEDGVWKLNYQPKKRKPIIEWLTSQGRYKHLLKPANKGLIKEIQEEVDSQWEKLQAKV